MVRDIHLDPSAEGPADRRRRCAEEGVAFWPPGAPGGARSPRSRATRSPTQARRMEKQRYPVLLENTLRLLVAVSPDVQTS
jgi:hypothetical protein